MSSGGLESLAPVDVDRLLKVVWSDTPAGYAIYYTLATGDVFPAHAWKWVNEMYRARAERRGIAIEGFRGSRKTTYVTNWFTSYQIGLHPERTNIFIQASDDNATDNAKFVASIIATNPAFRFCFPVVVPDESMGWGTEGYFVKRADLDYSAWRQMTSRDPTLIGAGYRAHILVGKHPSGLLIIDDIHGPHNTRSNREFRYTWEVHNQVIQYMPTETTWLIYIFTPWIEGDVGVWAKNNPAFVHCRTPAYLEENGKRTEKPTWPEVFPRERLLQMEQTGASSEFAQMMLLDLEAAKGLNLREEWLHYFMAESINASWPVYLGVDYASVAAQQEKKHTKRDLFALAAGRIQPASRNLIVFDGFTGHLTQPEAEDKVKEFVNRYRPVRVGMEQLGKGEEFFQHMLRGGLRTHLSGQTVGNRSKGERFEIQMSPLFKQAVVWLSDEADNPFLDELRKEWLSWDGHEKYYDDALDSVWHLIRVCKGALVQVGDDEEPDLRRKKKEKKGSLASLAWRGRRR